MCECKNPKISGGKFIEVSGTFGMIVRGDIDEMNDVIEYINEYTELKIVYQKASSNELYITNDKPDGRQE